MQMNKFKSLALKSNLIQKEMKIMVIIALILGQKSQMRQSNINAGVNYDDTKIGADGGYQASDYSHLPVSLEIKELFKSIQKYTPTMQDIDTKLRAFVPDFIPAIG